MNDDLISRQAEIDALVERTHIDWESMKIMHPALEVIDNLPSAEKRGKWIFDGCGTSCSECGYRPKLSGGWNYCPVCGARMEEV